MYFNYWLSSLPGITFESVPVRSDWDSVKNDLFESESNSKRVQISKSSFHHFTTNHSLFLRLLWSSMFSVAVLPSSVMHHCLRGRGFLVLIVAACSLLWKHWRQISLSMFKITESIRFYDLLHIVCCFFFFFLHVTETTKLNQKCNKTSSCSFYCRTLGVLLDGSFPVRHGAFYRKGADVMSRIKCSLYGASLKHWICRELFNSAQTLIVSEWIGLIFALCGCMTL